MVSARLILSLKMGRWYTARQPDIFVKTVSLLLVPLDVFLRIRVGFHQSSFPYRAMLAAVNYFATIRISEFLGSLLSSTGQVSVLDNNYPKKKPSDEENGQHATTSPLEKHKDITPRKLGTLFTFLHFSKMREQIKFSNTKWTILFIGRTDESIWSISDFGGPWS